MNEFELIRRYFAPQALARDDVVMGIGDDGAVVAVPAGMQLVIATDTLVEGVHFVQGADPGAIGHKALAVNLSDLAAMGAQPAWFTLNLTAPGADARWLQAFAQGLLQLARQHDVQLIGGDTTRGPLCITVTVCGFVPAGQALSRAGARPGDLIYVTGLLGDAGLGLLQELRKLALPEDCVRVVLERLHRPTPRVAVGNALRGLASACIDISDGLVGDLGHLLAASGVGACLELKRVPVSPAYDAAFAHVGWDVALAAGDDYELCFTLPPAHQRDLHRVGSQFQCGFVQIGVIEAEAGLRIRDESGRPFPVPRAYTHFAS